MPIHLQAAVRAAAESFLRRNTKPPYAFFRVSDPTKAPPWLFFSLAIALANSWEFMREGVAVHTVRQYLASAFCSGMWQHDCIQACIHSICRACCLYLNALPLSCFHRGPLSICTGSATSNGRRPVVQPLFVQVGLLPPCTAARLRRRVRGQAQRLERGSCCGERAFLHYKSLARAWNERWAHIVGEEAAP